MYTLLVIFSCLLATTWSHVALKYPPARKYDLDFLDSFRTVGSCGMNPGTERTQLVAGDQLNVTWHLGYPHGGGIKLQIMRDGNTEDLLPDWDSLNKYQQSQVITLPETPCQQCTLLLLRQATEWGKSYQFRSCSEISLVPADQVTAPACSGHGRQTAGGCTCDKGYAGSLCQYETECDTDADCGQGKCEILNNALFEEKACFCQRGFYGAGCAQSVSWTDDGRGGYDETTYTAVDTGSSSRKIMWKLVDDDKVEVVAEFASQSWVGVGWRPADSAKTCQKFPEDAPAPRGNDFHAMDCTDMVIGFAKNGRGWIRDFYTRDRSTPRIDSFWGGEDDLVSGDVWEQDGNTVMRFTKKLAAGTADHAFQGRLHLIWATGQTQDEFYKNDQLKYHGRQQRGIYVIDGPVSESSSQLHPAVAGVIVACILLFFVMIIQKGMGGLNRSPSHIGHVGQV